MQGLPRPFAIRSSGFRKSRRAKAAAGGLIGYDFGPVDLQVWVTDGFLGRDSPVADGNFDVWTRIGFKIWGPEQRSQGRSSLRCKLAITSAPWALREIAGSFSFVGLCSPYSFTAKPA
jgi:hypothetical protein